MTLKRLLRRCSILLSSFPLFRCTDLLTYNNNAFSLVFHFQSVIVFDASSNARDFKLKAIDESHVLLFAGKRLKEPIAWHGPIVMNTQEEIMQTFKELRSGNFPPVRVPWNYRKISEKR